MCRYRETRSTLVAAQPIIDGCDYVFPSRAKTPYSALWQEQGHSIGLYLQAMKKRAKKGGEGRAITELDPSRSAPHCEDVDGSRWRAARYF